MNTSDSRNVAIPQLTPGRHAVAGFSLVEILVAVSLLSFIVLGLLMMFNQTQRAFRMGMAQTDVLESGRIFTDMISREMEQMAPSNFEPLPQNNFANEMNFWAVPSWTIRTPAMQGLPGSTAQRTNIVQQFFFLTRHNQDWIGTGYTVLTNQTGTDVGTLFRFTATKRVPFYGAADLSQAFQNALAVAVAQYRTNGRVTTMNRVADGIVHLMVRPFGVDGRPLLPFNQSNLTVHLPNGTPSGIYEHVEGTSWTVPNQLPNLPEFAGYYFMGRAVPAAVEFEVGVLEPNILGRYRALVGNGDSQRNYLSNRVGNVHIFRQRVPVRNVDFSVYP